MYRRRFYGPTPSVAEPRPILLRAVREFVQAAGRCSGVLRISLLGSLTTTKAIPKDADVLVTIDAAIDLSGLARVGRRLKGRSQNINLGADVFLANEDRCYLGRICGYRECHARALCRARNCGLRQHLNDDLDIVTLSPELLASPSVDLWPKVVRRRPLPHDVEVLLLAELEQGQRHL